MYKENFNNWSDLWKNYMQVSKSTERKVENDSSEMKEPEIINDSTVLIKTTNENKQDSVYTADRVGN